MIADVSRGVSKDLLNASYTLGASRRDALLHVLTPGSAARHHRHAAHHHGLGLDLSRGRRTGRRLQRPRLHQYEGDARPRST